ncbi:MAG: hypothetical protein IID16_10220, partial [Candidatus Marinimicrobia bacterium]|nr:hypothetical protein [Candidatus Neomarinimicrobiota bacterium]
CKLRVPARPAGGRDFPGAWSPARRQTGQTGVTPQQGVRSVGAGGYE